MSQLPKLVVTCLLVFTPLSLIRATVVETQQLKQTETGACCKQMFFSAEHFIVLTHYQEIGQFQIAIPGRQCKKAMLIICGALVVCWHRTPPKIGQLQGAHSELPWKEALLHCLSCLGLCWHPTRPEIGQLQCALSELL